MAPFCTVLSSFGLTHGPVLPRTIFHPFAFDSARLQSQLAEACFDCRFARQLMFDIGVGLTAVHNAPDQDGFGARSACRFGALLSPIPRGLGAPHVPSAYRVPQPHSFQLPAMLMGEATMDRSFKKSASAVNLPPSKPSVPIHPWKDSGRSPT